MFNIVALRGRLSRPPELRVLPTGATLVGLEVTTKRSSSERAVTVPVVWHDAPAGAVQLDTGAEVVVVGHVARRFFRAGGVTQSRTEVVADCVVAAKSTKRVDKALRAAADVLDEALHPGTR